MAHRQRRQALDIGPSLALGSWQGRRTTARRQPLHTHSPHTPVQGFRVSASKHLCSAASNAYCHQVYLPVYQARVAHTRRALPILRKPASTGAAASRKAQSRRRPHQSSAAQRAGGLLSDPLRHNASRRCLRETQRLLERAAEQNACTSQLGSDPIVGPSHLVQGMPMQLVLLCGGNAARRQRAASQKASHDRLGPGRGGDDGQPAPIFGCHLDLQPRHADGSLSRQLTAPGLPLYHRHEVFRTAPNEHPAATPGSGHKAHQPGSSKATQMAIRAGR